MLRIYDKARGFMVSAGNERQWGAAYHNGVAWPPASVLEQDIAAEKSFVCQYGSRVVGTFYLTEGPDPTYAVIDGAWISDAPYSVVHRIATDGSVRGIGAYCVQWALKRTGHLRIDTHGDNKPMQRLMEKLGFTYCGIIHVEEDDDPRMAYEKVNGCAITS
ncbi:MAG: GNAT family N-acetyltransferase [Firmicutes bacterium]|nr:GNAT family N-acetyltransferase [Bacillota bacterium]